jgi:hypothetical protein
LRTNSRELEAAAEQKKIALTRRALKEYFEKEKANESKLPCEDYVDENVSAVVYIHQCF